MDHEDLPQHGHRYNINSRIMVAAVVVLFAVVLFVFLLHLYARWVWRYSRRRSVPSRRFYFAEEQDPLRLRHVGLDPKVMEKLPMFVYNAENNSSPLECAVCLSEFQENEKGRILPKCKHCFHAECIEMWFHSHSTCPLCRTSARPEEDFVAGKVEEEKVEVVAFSTHPDLEAVCVERGQTSSVVGESPRREMPQIVIDIPKSRTNSFSSPRDLGQVYSPSGSAKSPVSHLRSLSRMLSRDRDRDRKVFPDVEGADGGQDQL